MNGYDPVVGYLELGMPNEAVEELGGMTDVKKKTERHAELLLAAQMMGKNWTDAVETAKRLCKLNRKECGYFIHAAFCMHEVGNTAGAMSHLLAGPKALEKEALYHYNLACYYATLERFSEAEESLRRSFELDATLREVATKDKDLVKVRF